MGRGRPSKYKEEYIQKMLDFFSISPYEEVVVKKVSKKGDLFEEKQYIGCDFPTFSKFAVEIGVSRDTLSEWNNKHEEFSVAYKKCKELQRNILIVNGLKGYYNTAFACFTAKNVTDMRDKQEHIHDGNIGIKVQYVGD